MRHIRASLLLFMVALLAGLSVWAALSVFAPRGAVLSQPVRSSSELDLAASLALDDSSTEEDSNAAEIVLHSQLAAFGREKSGMGSATSDSTLLRTAADISQAEIVGEAAGMLRVSQYRGVMWSPPTQQWKAQYAVQNTDGGATGRWLDLGYFQTEVQAAYAYDEAVRRRGNGHANNYELNFPTVPPPVNEQASLSCHSSWVHLIKMLFDWRRYSLVLLPMKGTFSNTCGRLLTLILAHYSRTVFLLVRRVSLLPARQTCGHVPIGQPLRRPGVGQQFSAADCGFMPLARPEPYLSHQLMLLTDVIVTLNKTLSPTARMPVMLWAVKIPVESVCMLGCLLRSSSRARSVRRCVSTQDERLALPLHASLHNTLPRSGSVVGC